MNNILETFSHAFIVYFFLHLKKCINFTRFIYYYLHLFSTCPQTWATLGGRGGGGQGGQLPPLHIVSHGISDVSGGPVVRGYYTVLNTLKLKQKQLKDLANYLKYFAALSNVANQRHIC